MGSSIPRTVREEARETPVLAEVDVLVAGGGTAGLAAAIGAARAGASTLLTESLSFLGGTVSGSMMVVITHNERYVHGFPRQIFDRLAGMGGAVEDAVVTLDPELFKHVALEMVVESGARPLLYSRAVAPIMDGNTVKGAIIETKAGRQAVLAKTVIDATGDADIAALAGAQFRKGRATDGRMRPMTILFRVGNVDYSPLFSYMAEHPDQFSPESTLRVLDPIADCIRVFGFYDLVEQGRTAGVLNQDIHYLRLEGGSIKNHTAFINTTRVYDVDGTNPDDLTRAELEGRRQVMQVANFLRRYVPGFERSTLLDASSLIGVRETRHVVGEHELTAAEIREDVGAPDAVARSYTHYTPWYITHPPERGEGASTMTTYRMKLPIISYDLPYGMMVPKGVEGLLVAGRNASADNEAFESCRDICSCMHMGMGAGTAAAVALKQGVPVSQVDIREVQRLLAAQGVEAGKGAKGVLAAPVARTR